MKNTFKEKHTNQLPDMRKIKRTCNKELYRTVKKLKLWIPPQHIVQAEQLYYKKVIENLPFIVENGSNRRKLADWWDEHVCPDIAALWNVEPSALSKAFRDAFGG